MRRKEKLTNEKHGDTQKPRAGIPGAFRLEITSFRANLQGCDLDSATRSGNEANLNMGKSWNFTTLFA